MRQRIALPSPEPEDSNSDFEFKTPTNAARRLLAVIRRIESLPDDSSDPNPSDSEEPKLFDSPDMTQSFSVHASYIPMRTDRSSRLRQQAEATFSLSREKILEELRYIQRYVEALDDEYAELRFDAKLDL
jgi:hypothetical protein